MIYFIQNTETKAIKIGYTKDNPQRRLRALQTGSSHPLILLATFKGSVPLERRLHHQFKEYHLLGEWFEPGPSLVSALIERVPNLPIVNGGEEGEEVGKLVELDYGSVRESWYMVCIAYTVIFILNLM